MTEDEFVKKYGEGDDYQSPRNQKISSEQDFVNKYGEGIPTSSGSAYYQPSQGMSQQQQLQAAKKIPENSAMAASQPFLYKASEFVSQSPTFSRALKAIQPALDVSQKYIVNPVQKAAIPSIAGGAFQGIYDQAKSVADIPSDIIQGISGKKMPHLPNEDLSQYLPQDSVDKYAYYGGDILSNLLGFNKAQSALEKIPGLEQKSLTTSMAKGAALGGALGEQNPGGRTGSAIGGSILGSLDVFSPKAFADSIINEGKNQLLSHSIRYDNLMQEAKNSGVNYIPVPKINNEDLKGLPANSDLKKSYTNFIRNPVIENANKFQSDLGKASRKITDSKPYITHNVLSSKFDDVNYLESLQNNVRDNINQQLQKYGRGDLSKEYSNLSKSYKENVVPYFNENIQKYSEGKLSADALAKRINANDELKMQLLPRHSGDFKKLEIGNKLTEAKSDIKKGVGYGTGGYLSYELAKALGVGNEFQKFTGQEQ